REGARKFLEFAGISDEIRHAAGSPLQAQHRLESLEHFLNSPQRVEEREGRALAGYLQRLTLNTRDDDADRGGDVVTLVTLHGAKGLEFPVVFLVGLEEDLLPHRRIMNPIAPDLIDDSV